MPVETLTDTETFDNIIMNTDKDYILVDAYTVWCQPCKKLAPELVKFSEKYGEKIHFVKVDCDQAEKFVDRYNIKSLPTLFYLCKGDLKIPTECTRITGCNLIEIEKMLVKLSGNGIKINEDF